MNAKRVLIASPVQQKPEILREFLTSLEELEQARVAVEYLFFDDNVDTASSDLLKSFQQTHPKTSILTHEDQHRTMYMRNEKTHYWRDDLVWKVAAMKDTIIAQAKSENYDYLFLVDSDLVLHPQTLEQLLLADKDIISNLFWTRWQANGLDLPQVWMEDQYNLFKTVRHETLTDEEANRRVTEFLQQLRQPGVYEVGGLGACTLLSQKALQAGVSFAEIRNVSFWGEDRHFSIRAQALGFSLYVDTHHPAYHIYRESDLPGVARFKRSQADPTISISLCMIVKNEEDALARCLTSVQGIADEIIIVDTGSTDRTKEIARQFTDNIYDFEWIDDFSAARNFAFQQATQEYIFWLDADDVLEAKDQELLAELKRTLDPSVDSVMMHYHLAFDSSGNVTSSLLRNRLVRRDRQFRWQGVIHEFLEVGGHILKSEIAITHKKEKSYTDRNLKIYQKLAASGTPFSPRDLYYYGNELRDHGIYQEAIEQYQRFLDTQAGWVEDNIWACLKMADCYEHLGEPKKQRQALLKTLEYDKPRAEFCCRMGSMYMKEAQYEQAILWFRFVGQLGMPPQNGGMVEQASWTWLPHLQLCVCYDRLGDTQKAQLHNDIALLMSPNHPSMLYNKEYFEKKSAEQKS